MKSRAPQDGRSRGRPRSNMGHDIPDELIRVLRKALETKSHPELTLKEIAAEAGTSQEMIRYYYGNKDGLITAMMLESSRRIERTLSDLKTRLELRHENATRSIVTTLIRLYLSERPTTRVSLLEFQKGKSSIRDDYLARRSNLIIGALHDIILLMIERGVYRKTADARHLALSMMVLSSHPIHLLRALPSEWVTPEMLESEQWIDHVVSLFDSQHAPED